MLDAKIVLVHFCIEVNKDDDPCASSITCYLMLLSKVNSAYKSTQ